MDDKLPMAQMMFNPYDMLWMGLNGNEITLCVKRGPMARLVYETLDDARAQWDVMATNVDEMTYVSVEYPEGQMEWQR